MSKVIMFLSTKSPKQEVHQYTAPENNGKTYPGINSSDAPIRYLLDRDPEISKILCIVTEESKGEALEAFKGVVREKSESVNIKEINYSEDTFQDKGIKEILDNIEAGDKVWLETTGGFRNTGNYLFLISNIMQHIGVKIKGAVYSNFQLKKIEDVTELFTFFDLTNGIHEFVKFGSSRKLAEFYKDTPEIKAFFEVAESLRETMTLCKYSEIEGQINKLNNSYRKMSKAAKNDSLLNKLLPVYEDKFHSGNNRQRSFTIVDIIEWCVNNGLIQQALTLYTEKMPEYILNGKLNLKPDATDLLNRLSVNRLRAKEHSYKDVYEEVFSEDLCGQSRIVDFQSYLEKNWQLIANAGTVESVAGIKNIPHRYIRPIQLIVELRNLEYMYNSRSCSAGSKCPGYKEASGRCTGCRNDREANQSAREKCSSAVKKFYEEIDEDKINDFFAHDTVEEFNKALNTMDITLMNYFFFGVVTNKSSEYNLPDIVSNLEAYLDRRPYYDRKTGVDNIRKIIIDYRHMKDMRNQINHANGKSTSSESIKRFLKDDNRVHDMNKMSLEDVSNCILKALNTFR